jgi:hypothetical protein
MRRMIFSSTSRRVAYGTSSGDRSLAAEKTSVSVLLCWSRARVVKLYFFNATISKCRLRHHSVNANTHRRPPLGHLPTLLVHQPFQARFLITVEVTPEGPLAHPPNSLAASYEVSRPAYQLSYASSNRIVRISGSNSVCLRFSHLLTDYETGQITGYKPGQFICSLQTIDTFRTRG